MTLQPGKQTIAINILPNILAGKDNQTMKFGQLIEYNITNTFLEKLHIKYSRETILRSFFKKSKLSISLGSLRFCIVYLYFIPSRELSA